MACLLRNRGKWYRKTRLDIWGFYSTYYRQRIRERRKLDRTFMYWAFLKDSRWGFNKYMRGKYIFRLWNRPRFLKPKRLKSGYIEPRYLRSFYMILKKKTILKYIDIAKKGKLVRGFASTYLGYLEGRLFVVIYRLNIVNNIFLIKSLLNLGIFFVNFKKKKHLNTKIMLGDFIHIEKSWRLLLQKDMFFRLNKRMISRNINNFYCNFSQFFFVLYKVFNITNIHYPIRIDVYRAIDFIGPLYLRNKK